MTSLLPDSYALLSQDLDEPQVEKVHTKFINFLNICYECCQTWYNKDQQTFSIKDEMLNILGFAGIQSLPQLFPLPSQHANSYRRYMNECARLCSSKTSLTKAGGGGIWPTGPGLVTLIVKL